MFTLWIILALACGPERKRKPASDTALSCASGYVVDGDRCVPEACGTGSWGDLPVDTSTTYVDAAANQGGDGSADAPLTSIQAGLDLAATRGAGMVAVAAGTYAESLVLEAEHAGIHLAGRCSDLVVVDAAEGESKTGLLVDLPGAVELSGLTVQHARECGILVESGSATVRDSQLRENDYAGVVALRRGTGLTSLLIEDSDLVDNTNMSLGVAQGGTEVTVRRSTLAGSVAGSMGHGVLVYDGGTLTMEDCLVADNDSVGIYLANAGSSATLQRTTVRDTTPISDNSGDGAIVEDGASLIAEHSTFTTNAHSGVRVTGAGSRAILRGSTVSDTISGYEDDTGEGILAILGASVLVERCDLIGNTSQAVLADDEGSSVTLVDTRVLDTLPGMDSELAAGIKIQTGAHLAAERCEVAGNANKGIMVWGQGATGALRHCTVRDTLLEAGGKGGIGLQVSNGAQLSVESSTVETNRRAGIIAVGAGTLLTLRDTRVAHTQPDGDGYYGFGIYAVDGTALSLDGCELVGNSSAGLMAAHEGTTAVLRDTRIEGTLPDRDSNAGVGLAAESGAVVRAERLTATGNEGAGLYLSPGEPELDCHGCTLNHNAFAGAVAVMDSTLRLHDSLVTDNSGSVDLGGGVGIYAEAYLDLEPSLLIDGCTIRDNPVAGLWLAGDGRYEISDSSIGGGVGETDGSLSRCGDAVFVWGCTAQWDGTRGLMLAGNTLHDGRGAGLFLDDSTATLGANTWNHNQVDLVRQGSECTAPPSGYDTESMDAAELCPAWDYPTCTDLFRFTPRPVDLTG